MKKVSHSSRSQQIRIAVSGTYFFGIARSKIHEVNKGAQIWKFISKIRSVAQKSSWFFSVFWICWPQKMKTPMSLVLQKTKWVLPSLNTWIKAHLRKNAPFFLVNLLQIDDGLIGLICLPKKCRERMLVSPRFFPYLTVKFTT